MFEKRYEVAGLAHASYLIGSQGEAAVIDPKRDVDDYIADAKNAGLRIVAILETHPHADFVSGHCELAARTGACIAISHKARATYPHRAVHKGDVISVGSLEIVTLETPGHSPDSVCWLVKENGAPLCVFTGDTLFVGDVGRPDLRDADADPGTMAGALYDSLFSNLLTLPDAVKVFPAHGAGSLCGRNIGSTPSSTIGAERLGNWALGISPRPAFIEAMTQNLPERPGYFAHNVALNLKGAPALGDLAELRELSESEVSETAGAVVIDTRSAALFGEGHFAGSLNIGLGSALFSTWVGFMVAFGGTIVLVVEHETEARQARLALARIGYDNVSGYMRADTLTLTRQISQLSAAELKALVSFENAPLIVDVRTAREWTQTHIEGAHHIPLPALPRRLEELPRHLPIALLCGSGYRSSIAASFLQAHGFERVENVMGGMAAYLEADEPHWHPSDLVYAGEGI